MVTMTMLSWHKNIIQWVITCGLILFILIISLMGLSGVMANEEEEDTPLEPVLSSELNSMVEDQTAQPSSEGLPDRPRAQTFIFLPFIVQNSESNPNESGQEVPDTDFMNNQEKAVLDLVNRERAQAGCPAVEAQPHLREAAFLHSKDMADNRYFSHTGQNGSRFWERAEAAGYTGFAAGENIAAGYGAPEAVMNGWMNSSGHRANILNCRHTHLGVGYYYGSGSPYGAYWTQVFGQE